MIRKLTAFILFFLPGFVLWANDTIPKFGIYEVEFLGSTYKATDNPVRDVDLVTVWQHESGSLSLNINGFYDGDGQGGPSGNVFKVRFCPVKTGTWRLTGVRSNDARLDGQKEGLEITCTDSGRKGFWIADAENGNRWYKRSNGDHPYITGNTFYTFLSEYRGDKPSGGHIKSDVLNNARYLNKLRFAVTGDIFPNPVEKPFLDNEGKPTDDGNYSFRPNPAWFSGRMDLAVRLCFEQDVIADIILNGPDSENARRALHPEANAYDYSPYLAYMAARYGSYPNVWFCLSNEYDIRKPSYTPQDITEIGRKMSGLLAYGNPLSVHGNQGYWNEKLNSGDWNDHVIIQNKIKYLAYAADFNNLNHWIGERKPVINDELAYQGRGDGWSEEDVIEAMLGAFMGGGYASSGYKSFSKGGQYFAGDFNPGDFTAADNLLWLRQVIDQNITFWRMSPAFVTEATYKKDVGGSRSSIFYQLDKDFRVLEWKNQQYVLATNSEKKYILAFLPNGQWEIKMFNIITMEEQLLGENISGMYEFSSPPGRATLFVFTKINN